jgi:predicted nuclease with RNAse H fold
MRQKKVHHSNIVGIDLAGVAHRPTGICLLRGLSAETAILFSDEEILSYVRESRPVLAAIDAPLTLPPGRKTIEEKGDSHFRPCDVELRRRKIPFFPITLGPMRKLTSRGIRLQSLIKAEGVRVIEIYPGGAQDIWGIPRAKRNLYELKRGLSRLGIVGLKKEISAHELDAASGAYVGYLFLQGKAEIYGDFSTGAIVMPLSL